MRKRKDLEAFHVSQNTQKEAPVKNIFSATFAEVELMYWFSLQDDYEELNLVYDKKDWRYKGMNKLKHYMDMSRISESWEDLTERTP